MLYRFLNSKKGFTLVEIMVVVVIMSILVAVAVPILNTGLKKQKIDDCRNQRLVIETAVKQAMFGMIDNGEKQPKITFKCTTYSGDPLMGHSVVANDVIIGSENPEGEGYCFVLTDDPETCFTLAQLRGGYRPGTTAAFINQGLDDYKAGCDEGYYLKKIKYQADNEGKGTPFYKFLDNQEVPVCPFEEDRKTGDPYFYYVLEDGSVHCSCPECE